MIDDARSETPDAAYRGFLFSDMRGFTAFAERHGNAAAAAAVSRFLDLARNNPAVVCGIHRGLIAGSLERLGENGARVSLEPFVGPTTCLAHITTTTPFRTATA